MRFPRGEAQRILAARWFSRSGARTFALAYLTGAVLLLPSLLPAASAPAATDARAVLETRIAERATLLATARATVVADPPQVRAHVVGEGETLESIAHDFGVAVQTIAFNNGLTSKEDFHPGMTLTVPPVDGAVYVVRSGDTVESVSQRFGSDVKAFMDLNRLYFEPQNFAVGKTIVVPVPVARLSDTRLADPVARAQPAARGSVSAPVAQRLQWPVAGVITQYFWYGHSGVDIAAPYGAPIGASDAGVVSAVGWVAVGGLHVCVKHDWGMETCYYHTSAVYVSVGQRVGRGQGVAAIGMTGVTTGPHVHWEANLGAVHVNPLAY